MPLKILIADDHALLREGLRLLIHSQDDMNVVGEAEDGIETLEKVRSEQPDVLLLDIAMPRMTGLETIQMVHRIAPETGIVILSRYEKEAYVRKALKAGALGYVVKGEAGATMLEAIRSVAQGRFFSVHKFTSRLSLLILRPWMKRKRSMPSSANCQNGKSKFFTFLSKAIAALRSVKFYSSVPKQLINTGPALGRRSVSTTPSKWFNTRFAMGLSTPRYGRIKLPDG